jgi:REP element-mobilizing transposase RayT
MVGHTYILTTVCHYRRRWFEDPAAAEIVMDRLRDIDHGGHARSLAWVVMPDHVHWMLELDEKPLADVARRFKSSSALGVNRLHARGGTLWQPGYHDHAVRSDRSLREHAMYIMANPIRAHMTEQLGDYPYAWCIWPITP